MYFVIWSYFVDLSHFLTMLMNNTAKYFLLPIIELGVGNLNFNVHIILF